MPISEAEKTLLDGCKAGDERAWTALYQTYASDIGTFLKGMLGRHFEIEDLVQRVFLEFLSSIDKFRGDSSIRTWLHRIARFLALHELRGIQRRNKHINAYAELVEHEDPSAEARIDARQTLGQMERVLSELENDFREVWLLREVLGFSVDEAAKVLDLNNTTLRTRHYRARKKILQLLSAERKTESQPPAPILRLVPDKKRAP